jgi:hypothetical protein
MFNIRDIGMLVSENEVVSGHPNAPTHEDDDVHVKNRIEPSLEMQEYIKRRPRRD